MPLSNNAGVFEYINHLRHWTQLLNRTRHLQPVTNEQGLVICEGSPSRWQSISGLPDERLEYQKPAGEARDPMAEAIWEFMQQLK
ncbi:hypothetical protein HY946_00795 [Candidatus Gottesmanbacteria bacterium]|nr:hypothetical protein [Candidatus Gottesmanbacteria bacterium]